MKSNNNQHSVSWSSSVAMSWLWGLGLFFSVHFAYLYGIVGLLSFAIPNAVGLALFGIMTQKLADKHGALSSFYQKWHAPFNFILYLYQFLAIALTIFAVLRYFVLIVFPDFSPWFYLAVILLLILVAIAKGEALGIKRIRHVHIVYYVILVLIILSLVYLIPNYYAVPDSFNVYNDSISSYLDFIVPMLAGFLVGPWLDIQQWQKAIYIQRMGWSIRKTYIIGSVQFLFLILALGIFGIWVREGAPQNLADLQFYGRPLNYGGLTIAFKEYPLLISLYGVLVFCGVWSTLDSAYIAFKWFLKESIGKSKSLLLSLFPSSLFTSPIVHMLVAGALALYAYSKNIELMYFLVFYATLFVLFGVMAVYNAFSEKKIAVNTLAYSISIIALLISGVGYLYLLTGSLTIGTIIAAAYCFLARKEAPTSQREEVSKNLIAPQEKVDEGAPLATMHAVQATGNSSEYVEGKWYVYCLKPTYFDTNSVGNIYFANYIVWVGKARELFFNHCMPDFDLKNTDYYVLTRNFKHKFIQETKEFDEIKVKVRIKSSNRKFSTMEHKIYGKNDVLLGEGEQTLFYVDSTSYKPIDMPEEIKVGIIRFF